MTDQWGRQRYHQRQNQFPSEYQIGDEANLYTPPSYDEVDANEANYSNDDYLYLTDENIKSKYRNINYY